MALPTRLPDRPSDLERALRGIRLTQAEHDRVLAHLDRIRPRIRPDQHRYLHGMIVKITTS
ncbi:hypothetical protein [Deinococcus radiotolerans]|uniref:Uncharacterized protein n=1 Tax=Deinococcus radiotolerans TaxID=1309407 RepID=A0ABQ2FR33_9DEIO|nr:hypothetical protein [Deinococcus radiotolerans]GGL18452.1 hypothetical protein GCM10010844_41620 [Deinococcus radiotolerans]